MAVVSATECRAVVAALATACCAEYLGAMHELTTTPVDFVCWAAALLAVTERVMWAEHPDTLAARAGLVRWTSRADDDAGNRRLARWPATRRDGR